MSSRTINDAASPVFPTSTHATTIGTSGATVAISFTSGDIGRYYTFVANSAWTARADATASATAGDLPYRADVEYPIKVTRDRLRVSVRMAATGTLYWARTSP